MLHCGLLMDLIDLHSRSPELGTETFEAAPPGISLLNIQEVKLLLVQDIEMNTSWPGGAQPGRSGNLTRSQQGSLALSVHSLYWIRFKSA